MTLDDDKVKVTVDEKRMHDVYVGVSESTAFNPDGPDRVVHEVYMTTFVPYVQLHLRMTPQVARDIAAALVAFADQADMDAEGEQFHRGSRA